MHSRTPRNIRFNERGTLLVAVLFILLVTTILGLSAMDATGLEMQMSSNSREQLTTFAAAEYVIAQVTTQIAEHDGFSNNSLSNHACDDLCFDDNCTGGYCFFGADSAGTSSWQSCMPGVSTLDATQEDVWSDNSGMHNQLSIPDTEITAKFIIEFRCYAAIDESLAMDDANNTKVFRITTLVTSVSKRSRVMLRVTLKNL
ncbi:MAG: PilX N-terminal domain-containing pilus assembly protein [Pseudomonadota bacterium]